MARFTAVVVACLSFEAAAVKIHRSSRRGTVKAARKEFANLLQGDSRMHSANQTTFTWCYDRDSTLGQCHGTDKYGYNCYANDGYCDTCYEEGGKYAFNGGNCEQQYWDCYDFRNSTACTSGTDWAPANSTCVWDVYSYDEYSYEYCTVGSSSTTPSPTPVDKSAIIADIVKIEGQLDALTKTVGQLPN